MRVHGDLSCILLFDDESAEFARGFEAGRVWTSVRSNEQRVEEIVHTSNVEMMLRIAEACRYRVTGEELDETWTRVSFEPLDEPN